MYFIDNLKKPHCNIRKKRGYCTIGDTFNLKQWKFMCILCLKYFNWKCKSQISKIKYRLYEIFKTWYKAKQFNQNRTCYLGNVFKKLLIAYNILLHKITLYTKICKKFNIPNMYTINYCQIANNCLFRVMVYHTKGHNFNVNAKRQLKQFLCIRVLFYALVYYTQQIMILILNIWYLIKYGKLKIIKLTVKYNKIQHITFDVQS